MTEVLSASPSRWGVVVAAKPLPTSKSRLRVLGDAATVDLVAAMFEDSMSALAESALVGSVVVVTSDPELSAVAHSYGAVAVRDPDRGLNGAFVAGTTRLGAEIRGVAFLPGDLPCVTGPLLDACLESAAWFPATVVPDAEGCGTTMLTQLNGRPFEPRFGSDSLRRHVAAGAHALHAAHPALRRDVDTPEDLSKALRIGAGTFTSAVCARLRLSDDDRIPA
jgi:2-phospho-L-lactate/phosphoenolpyruvate guanylyltransferase